MRKSTWTLVALLLGLQSYAWAKTSETHPGTGSEAESSIATVAIEKLVNSIKLSSCDFDVEGSSKTDPELSIVDRLDLDCMAHLSDKTDLEIPLVEESEGLGSILKISSKNLFVHFTLKQELGVTKGNLKFYSGYDKTKGTWIRRPVDLTVSILNGKKVMNAEVIALQLSEASVVLTPDSQNKKISLVQGQCVAQKKIFNLGTLRDELRPADCRFEGLHDGEELSQFNFTFKSAIKAKNLP